MIYVTSDLHLNHTNILKYETESRPFDSLEEMNQTIVNNWNSVVKNSDIVYVLGDFILGNPECVPDFLSQLNGTIILIRGNHDSASKIRLYQEYGIRVENIEYIQYKGLYFILLHFPLVNNEFFELLTQNNSECVLLYGHLHGLAPKGYYKNTYHVGMDTNNLTPISLEQIWLKIKENKE